MKKILLCISLFFLGFSHADALFCDYTELSKIRKQAMQVNITSDYKELEDSVVFTITIYNLSAGQYVIDTTTGKEYIYDGEKENPSELVIDNITKPGMYKFEVYSVNNDCNDNSLNTLYIELPTYNKYYKDSLCEGIESYKLCQRWMKTNLTYDEFKKAIEEYKARKLPEKIEEEIPSIWERLLSLYIQYYYIVLPILILVLSIPIYIIYQKKYKVDF